jgi:hypothetical protein
MTDEFSAKLAEIRHSLDAIKVDLPTSVEDRGLNARARIPFKALCCRAGLLWRIEELGRATCDSCDKGDVVAAMVLTRSLIESACALWYLKELIARQVETGVELNLDDLIMSLLVGTKITGSTGPAAINVLTFIDRAAAIIPRLRNLYDNLSESAHPNFDGTGGVFSKIDKATNVVRFGRGVSSADFRRLVVPALTIGVLLARRAHDAITAMMPEFVQRCEEGSPDAGRSD